MMEDQLKEENSSIPTSEKIPFPWFTLAAVMCTVLGAVLLISNQQRRKSGDEFRYDNLGAEQYRFKLHPSTEYYQSFKATYPEDAKDNIPLQKALLERAVQNAPLMLRLSQEASSVTTLYSRSMISEAAWKSFHESEEMLKQEIENVRDEADELKSGWGSIIWQQAVDLHHRAEQIRKAASTNEAAKTQKAEESHVPVTDALPKETDNLSEEQRAEIAQKELLAMIAEEEQKKKSSTLKRSNSRRGSKKHK